MLYYSKLFLVLQRLYLVSTIVDLIAVLITLFFLQIPSLSELKIVDFYQEYSTKYIYSTSQISKLSLTLYTFSVTSLVL